ncbi:MAG: hypothetical protein RI996_32 [Candidatus Parcubacteria bacterium]|jgi:hypothetical protein
MPNGKVHRQIKICPSCQRPFTNRKRWESRGIWNEIVYCSDRCRKAKKI